MKPILAFLAAILLPSCSMLAPKVPYVAPAELIQGHATFCNSLTE